MLDKSRYKKRYLILIIIIICLISGINANALEINGKMKVNKEYLQELEKVHIKKVIDGDTIIVTGKRKVRFIGVDTPEFKDSFYAKTATAYTKEKLLNKNVYIEIGKEKYDKFGRLLAYIYTEDGRLFNACLLKDGHAMVLMIPPNNKYINLMREMAAEARDNERGLWEDLPILSWENAGDYSGKMAIIRGKIIATYNSGKAVFLNFNKEYWHTFSAVIFKSNLYRFKDVPAEYYLNKQVRIMGKVREYKGAQEIIIKFPEQIMVYR